jgi:PspAB-like protein
LGFLDALLGGRRKLSGPAPDRLFAMSTAYVQLETGLGIKSRGSAGLVFQPLGTADFESLMKDTEELLASASQDTGTTTETKVDEYGYRWAILRDPDFEDIVVAINTVSSQLETGGYGDRLLCAVFAFEENGKPVYWIYNYKRGTFYPFVPTGKQARDSEREFRLKAQMADELPLEQEIGRDLPLWDIPL